MGFKVMEGVRKSLHGYEKSIPDKILHRSSGPKKSQLFFSSKKIILKMKKYLGGGVQNFEKYNIFSKEIFDFPLKKFLNFENFEKFPKKHFFIFKIIFFK